MQPSPSTPLTPYSIIFYRHSFRSNILPGRNHIPLLVNPRESIFPPPPSKKMTTYAPKWDAPLLASFARSGNLPVNSNPASLLLKSHLLNPHAAQESAPAAAVRETLPLGLSRGHALRFPHPGHLDSLPARPRQSCRRSERRRNPPQTPRLRRNPARHRHHQRNLPVPHPLDRNRRLARHRVRPAQRSFSEARKPVVFLLPASPHWRHYGPRHQR